MLKYFISFIPLVLSLFVLMGSAARCGNPRIGVILPATSGTETVTWKPALEWAVQQINAAGGVVNRELEIVYKQQNAENLEDIVSEFISDSSIVAVIGPADSNDMLQIAPAFEYAQKILISPSATSGSIFRQFGRNSGGSYIWRTVESDVAQAKILVNLAKDNGAGKIALISTFEASKSSNIGPKDTFGTTFFDSVGFFAEEIGLPMTIPIRYDPKLLPNGSGYSSPYARILRCAIGVHESRDECGELHVAAKGKVNQEYADTIIIAVSDKEEARKLFAEIPDIKSRFKGKPLRFLVADGIDPSDIKDEKSLQDPKLEVKGVYPIPIKNTNPQDDFATQYRAHFLLSSTDEIPKYAANAYDAVLLVAYGLQRSHGLEGPHLQAAMKEVVSFRSDKVYKWNEFSDALKEIADGNKAQVSGAASTLRFDATLYTDVTFAQYQQWTLKNGLVKPEGSAIIARESQETGNIDISIGNIKPTKQSGFPLPQKNLEPLPAQTGSWALIVAVSYDWENYRHQADALRTYWKLRSQGIPDSRIVLIYADDLVDNPRNPRRGKEYLINVDGMGSSNLYQRGINNYRLCEPKFLSEGEICKPNIKAAQILDILSGKKAEGCLREPCAIRSNASENIYVYIVGHGSSHGVAVNHGTQLGSLDFMKNDIEETAANAATSSTTFITPKNLAETIQEMHQKKLYRQLFLEIETCHSGVLGAALNANTPEALLLTAASPVENSYAADYSWWWGTFLGDLFSLQYLTCYDQRPLETLEGTYTCTYLHTPMSHVGVYGADYFTNASQVLTGEFMSAVGK